MRFLLITIVLISLACSGISQPRPYVIKFIEGQFRKQISTTGTADSATIAFELIQIRNELFSKGHLLANVDQLSIADTIVAEVYVGPEYLWHSLGVQNIPEEYLSKAGFRHKDFFNKTVNSRQFNRLLNALLRQAINEGYPFAQFQLTEIELVSNSIKGILDYYPGPVIRYDSLTVEPASLVKSKYMEAYLNVREDDLFNYDNVQQIESSVRNLSYVNLANPVEVKFENNLCNISIGLEKVKSNRFDAIIGFLPNQGKEGGMRITGYADLHLENLFKAGKSLTFNWQQFQSLSQNLSLDYKHPNLFKSQIGLGLEANLIRQDTSFLNTDLNFNIFYVSKGIELSLLTDLISARQLSNPVDSTRIPIIGDYSMSLFGVNLAYDNIGNNRNPISGYNVSSSFKVGGKSVRKNPALPESVYDSLSLSSTQFQFKIAAEYNTRLFRSFVFHANLQAGALWNNDRLFVNDLFRLGGVNSLRGFNELDLYVSSFALLRLEMRLIMNEASRLFLFYDQSITSNSVAKTDDFPLGFGAGIYLRTGGGDLQLIYALGVSQEQSLSLDQSKIHLGYVASF